MTKAVQGLFRLAAYLLYNQLPLGEKWAAQLKSRDCGNSLMTAEKPELVKHRFAQCKDPPISQTLGPPYSIDLEQRDDVAINHNNTRKCKSCQETAAQRHLQRSALLVNVGQSFGS
jgi:hypothetical protein